MAIYSFIGKGLECVWGEGRGGGAGEGVSILAVETNSWQRFNLSSVADPGFFPRSQGQKDSGSRIRKVFLTLKTVSKLSVK
jgi:hypothetical protein